MQINKFCHEISVFTVSIFIPTSFITHNKISPGKANINVEKKKETQPNLSTKTPETGPTKTLPNDAKAESKANWVL
ncbi:MAG: hypothetical protein CM1200mP16_03160 [Nitrospina sp.]|nr:MAG: hypothetical protein CM1200mP16_03160 [Nitrospina sp.]